MLSGGLGDATCSISLGTRVVCHWLFVRAKQPRESSAASCSVYNIFHGRRFRSFRVALLNSALTFTGSERLRLRRILRSQSFFEFSRACSRA